MGGCVCEHGLISPLQPCNAHPLAVQAYLSSKIIDASASSIAMHWTLVSDYYAAGQDANVVDWVAKFLQR